MSRHTQTASHWGVYNVETSRDGSIGSVTPFACDQRNDYLKRNAADKSNRGGEFFGPVIWEAALTPIEQELRRVRAGFGNESFYGGSYGWASAGRLHHLPSVLKRFLELIGGYVDKLSNHSFGAAAGIVPQVLRRSDAFALVTLWPEVAAHTKLVAMSGGILRTRRSTRVVQHCTTLQLGRSTHES
ncbi:hypothetical protein V1283_005854 [Bradyrhizobium sp. AZCC 2262]|uniref:molybdopterin-dependent oxidoreductase n=1 Tax=Bradyrhizobium sp. AZCC 2262 TaxID=3117022 RepID=UPI002FF28DC4